MNRPRSHLHLTRPARNPAARCRSLGTALAAVALAGAGCLSLACTRAGTEIVVQGSPTFLPVAKPAVAAYRPSRPPSAVLLAAGSAEAVRALLAGNCDLAALVRELTPEESRRARDAGIELRTFRLGYAAAVPIVQHDNPVAALTVAQLRGIWSGAIRRWSEVGGADLPIHVVTRAAGSPLADLWDERVMGGLPTRADATPAGGAGGGDPDPVAALVGKDPAAIGFGPGMGDAGDAGTGVKPLAVAGVAATEESLKSGRYALGGAIYLVLDGRTASDTVQGFVDFLLEPAGQRLVRRAGYLPV
jgi:phosphate transport system substrate-binding protein